MTWKERVEFRQHVKNKFPFICDIIMKNPRKCSKCGCVERLDNIILEYNGIFYCDDCLPSNLPVDDLPF